MSFLILFHMESSLEIVLSSVFHQVINDQSFHGESHFFNDEFPLVGDDFDMMRQNLKIGFYVILDILSHGIIT